MDRWLVEKLKLSLVALPLLLASCDRRDPPPVDAEGQIEIRKAELVVSIVAPLIDPAKLDTLKGERPANRRVRQIAYWLETARRDGHDPQRILRDAQASHGMAGTPRAEAVVDASLYNLETLRTLGCFDDAGMDELRRGRAPTITKGEHAGTEASVDDTLPRSVVPELDARLYNLRFMPEAENTAKGAKIDAELRGVALRWCDLGLLSEKGLRAIEKVAK